MNKTGHILQQLRDYESRNVTFLDPDGSWPIVWDRARGVKVWDVDGREYLDLTAAFGVAAAGHANPRVVRAGERQMGKLLHAMGDVHPHALKAELARKLSGLTFERWTSSAKAKSKRFRGKTIFCNSGFEAVEAALKTALLATGKSGVIAFSGAYHGLGYGALNATHREHFRGPFRTQLRDFASFLDFPVTDTQLAKTVLQLRQALHKKGVGAILVEPIQARGGINIPPPDFLPLLRKLCNAHGVVLIFDEIYTGFGRTGKWFAAEHSKTVPDLICLGKALTGGFPLSACVGRAELMDVAWPISSGEAIHTSTFLGHPVGCAMALAQIAEVEKILSRVEPLGHQLIRELKSSLENPQLEISIRGQGLMIGIELCLPGRIPATIVALRVVKEMLRRGFILLPEGEHGNIISLTPPLTITRSQLTATACALQNCLR